MPQHTAGQVLLAAKGVDKRAVGRLGDGIDREVAARQVLRQRHIGRGMEGEAVITAAALALGARQRDLFARLWMQEDREVLANGLVAQGQQLLGRAAHSHPVAVADRLAQQAVAHGAADDEELHGAHDAAPWGRAGQRGVLYGSSSGTNSCSLNASAIHAAGPAAASRRSMYAAAAFDTGKP